MKLWEINLPPAKATLWFLGQAGYVIQTRELSVVIDPYLTDSVAEVTPEFGRIFPPPMVPEELQADIFIVTHNHGDHLDPQTILRYQHKQDTNFIAPRLAARRLAELGVPLANLIQLNAGEELALKGITIKGVFALPTGPDVLDTTGYLLTFPNGRSVYHTSDTGFVPLVLQAAPKNVDVLLVPINGKWGNLTIEQAVELTAAVNPRYVLPNHFDLMALNSENPETFQWFCRQRRLETQCILPDINHPFVWE
jgi:L-ascorbate 6-phosphate lactonase